MSDDEPKINHILLDDFENQDINANNGKRKEKAKKKKKFFYVPFIPRIYWLFYRRPVNFLIFIPSFTEGWCNMVTTVCMGNIIDAINKENGLEIVKKNSIYALIVSIVCAIFAFINYSMWIKIGDLITIKAKRLLFKSFMTKDIEFFDRNPIGNLLVLLQQDCATVGNAFTELKTTQISAFGKFFASVFVMYSIDFKLSTFSLLISISIILMVKVFRRFGVYHYIKYLEIMSQSVTISDESVYNEKVIFSFNRQAKQVKLYDDRLKDSIDHDSRSRFCMRSSFCLGNMINESCVSVILNIGGYFVLKSKITAGSLFTLSRAAIWAGREINHLFDTFTHEQRAIDSSNRVFEIIDLPVEVKNEGEIDEIELERNFVGKVEFKNVWFKYPTRDSWILKNVSFETEPSQISAIVGHSGSGKSTIVQLLLRFYDIDQGEILLDNINIKKYPLEFLHRNVGVVQQDPVLFTMSIRDNIAYAKPDATYSEIVEAAKIANAAKFIEKLPEKYDTLCGEKGMMLSGGQIQRIAIARVVIENPKLLITDEATSALDAESESLVQAALDKVMNGRASIIIAHRLGTIRAAKKIFVFDQGEIVESGTHEELLQLKGAYYNLIQRQLSK
ncbi:hypothetical protein M9Y10_010745 [Tritrichomonas musculus]|uniref:ABC transporter family protein n=1 Tax=Tritrichomonas musculus TaxID=1915356 RepID=A0ABR2IMU6_9EUKA